jgi:hypothetical protein
MKPRKRTEGGEGKNEEAERFEPLAGRNNQTGEVWYPKKRHSVDLERLTRAKACGRFSLF